MLTILIPTYNRVSHLEKALDRLKEEINNSQLNDQVEIVVSDNSSSDNTKFFLKNWKDENKELRFRFFSQSINKGVVNNIIFLIKEAQERFWIFYGDDDFLPKKSLPLVIDHLKTFQQYPIHVFNQTDNQPIELIESITSNECAQRFFYYMGNACTVANTSMSKKVLAIHEGHIQQTCWPQTHIYFLILNQFNRDKTVKTSPINIFSRQEKGINNIPNSFYLFDAAFSSLIFLALKLIPLPNNKIEFQDLLKGIKGRNYYYNFLIKRVLFCYFLVDNKVQRKSFRKLLYRTTFYSNKKIFVYLIPMNMMVYLLGKTIFKYLFILVKTLINWKKSENFTRTYKSVRKELVERLEAINNAKNNIYAHEINEGEW